MIYNNHKIGKSLGGGFYICNLTITKMAVGFKTIKQAKYAIDNHYLY